MIPIPNHKQRVQSRCSDIENEQWTKWFSWWARRLTQKEFQLAIEGFEEYWEVMGRVVELERTRRGWETDTRTMTQKYCCRLISLVKKKKYTRRVSNSVIIFHVRKHSACNLLAIQDVPRIRWRTPSNDIKSTQRPQQRDLQVLIYSIALLLPI